MADPTPAERLEMDRMWKELRRNGYVPLAEHSYPGSGRVLRVGARVRHRGERYYEAYRHGTGNVAGSGRAAQPAGATAPAADGSLVPGAGKPAAEPRPAGIADTARGQLPAAVRPAAEPEPGADQDAAKSDHGTVDTRTDGRTDRGSDRLRITSRS